MKIKEKLVSNTVYLFLDWFAVTFLSYIFWIIIGKTLSPMGYGIVSTTLNFVGLLSSVLLLGLGGAVSKLIPEYLTKKKIKFVNYIIKTSFKITILMVSIISIILVFTSVYVASLFKFPIEVVLVIVIILLAISLSRTTNFIIYGFQDMRKLFITDSFGQILRICLTTFLIFIGLSYFGPLIATSIGLLTTALLRMKFSWFFSPYKKAKSLRWLFANYAFPAFIGSLSFIVFMNSPYVILTILQDPQTTGLFSVSMLSSSLLFYMSNILNKALFPIISQLSANGRKKKQAYLVTLILRYILFISIPLAVLLMLFSKVVILIFSSPLFLEASSLYLILTPSLLLYGCGKLFLASTYAIGKTKVYRNLLVICSIIFIILALPLTYFYSAFGISLAYVISTTLLTTSSFLSLKKYIKIKFPTNDVLKLIFATGIMVLFIFPAAKITSGLFFNIFIVVIGGFIYLTMLILLKFYKKEDLKVLEVLAYKSPILRKQLKKLVKIFSKFVKYQ